ncbi:hypothetical protein RUND412_007759 [Rhizina undulata]
MASVEARDAPSAEKGVGNGGDSAAGKKKVSTLRRAWNAVGLDIGTVLMMAKGALPPTIAIAMLQVDSVSAVYGTMGYLVVIIAALSLCIMPRVKMLQMTIQNAIAICIAAAASLFGFWTANLAREHSPSPAGTSYNASAATISAMWLFINIWLLNTVRAKRPELAFPAIMYTIFTSIIFSYGATFTLQRAISTAVILLKAFMTGFGLALGVSLIVIPVNCRVVWFKKVGGYIILSKLLLVEQKNFIQNLEACTEKCGPAVTPRKKKFGLFTRPPPQHPLELAREKHADMFSKVTQDLPMAKREFGYGIFRTVDLAELHRLLRATVIPLQGMTVIMEIFKRMEDAPDGDVLREDLAQIISTLYKSYSDVVQICCDGLEHSLLVLGIKPPAKTPKAQNDEEAQRETDERGQPGFAKKFQDIINEFHRNRIEEIHSLFSSATAKDSQSLESIENPEAESKQEEICANVDHRKLKLYFLLFTEYLLHCSSLSILSLVNFADTKSADKTTTTKHFFYPTPKRLRKLFLSRDNGTDEIADLGDVAGTLLNLEPKKNSGDARKDPEHLPAGNFAQKLGNAFASSAEWIGSPESGFGFRVACATISMALPAFFEDSWAWFIKNRVFWGMLVIAIGMSPTSGASVAGLLGRVLGTVVAMVLGLINWYIVDGNTAGVIVFMWITIALQFYFVLKFPATIQITLTGLITEIMIIGYEVQVRKLGPVRSAASGQPVLDIDHIGPQRLLLTLAGVVIAYIFTIFPFPVTTRSLIRRSVSTSLHLMSQTYASTTTLLHARLKADTTAEEAAQKATTKQLTKGYILYEQLRANILFTHFEPSLRGPFPRDQYERIINASQNIAGYLAMITYASKTFSTAGGREWVRGLPWGLEEVDLLSNARNVVGVLGVLGNCLGNGQRVPMGFCVGRGEVVRLPGEGEGSGGGMGEEWTAWATVKIAAKLIEGEVRRLEGLVEGLVGGGEWAVEKAKME